MRIHSFLLLVLPCLFASLVPGPVARNEPVVQGADGEFDPSDWEEALTHVFDEARVRAPANSGAMGTSALAVELGKVPASLLVDRRQGGQVSLFLGWAVPRKYQSDVEEDLRVRFELLDGTTRVTPLYAGGGTAIQFASPFDVEVEKLKSFTLLHRKKARWLSGK